MTTETEAARGGSGAGAQARGLRRRLLTWFLLLSLIPLFVSNTVGYVESQEIVARLVRRYLTAIGELQGRHVRDQVDRHLLALETVVAGNEFLAAGAAQMTGIPAGWMGEVADRAAVEAHLGRKLAELDAFDALVLRAPDGRLLASVGAVESGGGPPSRGEEVVARFARVRGPASDHGPHFLLTAPVEREGATVAYLSGIIGSRGLHVFWEIPEHLAGSIESAVVDEQGRPLFVSHPHSAVDYEAPLATPLIDSVAPSFGRYRDREGLEVIGTIAGVPGLPWYFLAEVPVADALGPLQLLRRISLLFEVLLALTVVGVAWLVAGGIVAPVHRLVQATRRIGKGEMTVRVSAHDRDEIGELGRAFNDMARELSEAAAKVRELHQREIERVQQLATVGELASGVAHEIKNPVVGISNGLDLVRRHVGPDSTLDPITEEMSRQLKRIEAAVRDLLSYARPAMPTLAPTNPGRVMQRAVRLIQPAAEHAGVEIRSDLGTGLPTVLMDEELIHQALVNLLMNALQATSAGGQVRVGTRGRGAMVELLVEDTGHGITPNDLEHIFKPFYTTRHSGTGLGLSITREIVERHGGSLTVQSQVGEGSTFVVTLPAQAPTVHAAPAVGEEVVA